MRSNGQPDMTTEKKRKDAARKAKKRAAESGDEAKERKQKNAEREANRRREESEAESAKRKAANAQRDAKRRKAETKEASEQRRAKNATRMRKRRAIYPSKYAALTPLNENDIEEHYLGKMDQVCRFCTAKYFAAEKSGSGTFSSCCHGGTVPTPPVRQVPGECLQSLQSKIKTKFVKK
jgi:membrane protein involved in colicin uptake